MITFFSLIINKGRKASKTLTWPQRLQILSDAAQGNESDNKHANILSDDSFTISLCQLSQSH